ncbi:MAG: HIT family protein [Desulfovibrionaceae bacterium]|nr:HIT family protein [Desulfovibrionaceae bacterium]
MSEKDCIFCRIVRGEIPCARVYEDDAVLAFLDLGPVRPGHTLLVPKAHCATLLELPGDFGPALIAGLKKVGRAVMAATGATGFHVLQNNFSSAGQSVFHAHWHIIPREDGDGLNLWPQGAYPDSASMQETAAAIAAQL